MENYVMLDKAISFAKRAHANQIRTPKLEYTHTHQHHTEISLRH